MRLVQCTNSWVRVLMLVLLAAVILQAGEQGKEKPPPLPYDVSGDVVDQSGAGVAGVSIVFLKLTPPNNKDGVVTTDASGHFTRKGLPGNQAYFPVPEKTVLRQRRPS